MLEANSNEPDIGTNLRQDLRDLAECPLGFGLAGKDPKILILLQRHVRDQDMEFVVEVIRSLTYAECSAFEILNGEVFAPGAQDLTSIQHEGFVLLLIKGIPMDLEVPSSASVI